MAIHESSATTGVRFVELSLLDLDADNPRFGEKNDARTQGDIAEQLVEQYGIKDVLASLSVNGYFESEPLVARIDDARYVIAEGNRRLCACLILAKDPRVESLWHLAPEKLSQSWSAQTEIPVLVMAKGDEDRLLPYLGVRHIVGSQAWDSFAKARWIDSMLTSHKLDLAEISRAVGDSSKTIQRMLFGYRFVKQLRDAGHFRPSESSRRGRGSNPEFPFSWVYTLLGYSQVRDYLELEPPDLVPTRPIPQKREGDAARAVAYMFGSKEVSPAITDSRQIPELADALVDPVKRDLLYSGKVITEITRLSKTGGEQLAALFREITESMRAAQLVMVERPITPAEAVSLQSSAVAVFRSANELNKKINSAAIESIDVP